MPKKAAPVDLESITRNAEAAEALLKLLANAKRLLILCHLIGRELPVGQLAGMVGLSQSALSQHLAKMREQGLVANRREGQMIFYRVASKEAEVVLSALHDLYCA